MWDSLDDVKVGTTIKIKTGCRRKIFHITDAFKNRNVKIAKISRVEKDRTYPIRIKIHTTNDSSEYLDISFEELAEYFIPCYTQVIKTIGGDLYQ